MSRIIMACLGVLMAFGVEAQINSFRLQASGLTCALCARSIHKNLETVPWISRVETDLEKSEFVISVKPDMTLDPDLIRKRVEDAGFGVAGLSVNARIRPDETVADRHVSMNGMYLHIISVKSLPADGALSMRLIDKVFLGTKDQKRYARASRHECFLTGKASGECCRSASIPEGSPIFHVIL
jgi:copper chaperone CopZ